MDEDNCMVDIAKFFLEFTVDESCGKCTPCRIGNKRLLELLTKVTEGKATMEDLDRMEQLCNYIKANSLCGLGQTAPNPVLSTLRYFREEYIAHVKDKVCPSTYVRNLSDLKLIRINVSVAVFAHVNVLQMQLKEQIILLPAINLHQWQLIAKNALSVAHA